MPCDECICRRFLISGRVQGVGFRFATVKQARELSLTGHACNQSDGRVEVIACGSTSAIAALEAWLHEGPPHAHVRAVSVENIALSNIPTNFTIH